MKATFDLEWFIWNQTVLDIKNYHPYLFLILESLIRINNILKFYNPGYIKFADFDLFKI